MGPRGITREAPRSGSGSWLLNSNGDNGAGLWLLTSNENNGAGSRLLSSNGDNGAVSWLQPAVKTMLLARGCGAATDGDNGVGSCLLSSNEDNGVGSWLLRSNGHNGVGSWLLNNNENKILNSSLRFAWTNLDRKYPNAVQW